jgi:hypothetical protein
MLSGTSGSTQRIDQALDAYSQTLEELENALLEFEEALLDFEENASESAPPDDSKGRSSRLLAFP